jgi:hypothetical protein
VVLLLPVFFSCVPFGAFLFWPQTGQERKEVKETSHCLKAEAGWWAGSLLQLFSDWGQLLASQKAKNIVNSILCSMKTAIQLLILDKVILQL